MAATPDESQSWSKTEHTTKRALMRAERKDDLRLTKVDSIGEDCDVPSIGTVVQRVITYYGPKLRIEAGDEQFLLTAPGPDSEALLWRKEDSDWKKTAEVQLEFSGSLPQYDICPGCGEPLSTIAHERRAAIGTCKK